MKQQLTRPMRQRVTQQKREQTETHIIGDGVTVVEHKSARQGISGDPSFGDGFHNSTDLVPYLP